MTPVKMIDLDKEISDLEHEEIEVINQLWHKIISKLFELESSLFWLEFHIKKVMLLLSFIDVLHFPKNNI